MNSQIKRLGSGGLLALLFSTLAVQAAPPQPSNFEFYERFIGIDDACAWPKLSILPNGQLAVLVWPHNNHGATEGTIECWISTDHGVRWSKGGVPVPNAPGTNRVHSAGGVMGDALIALEGGIGDRPPYYEGARFSDKNVVPFKTPNVPISAAISKDGGKSWTKFPDPNLPKRALTDRYLTPFGRIAKLSAGGYGVVLYGDGVYFYTTQDGGATWIRKGVMVEPTPGLPTGGTHNETSWVELKNGDLYAASRSYDTPGFVGLGGLDGFRSRDGGVTWKSEGALALPGQFPADLTALPDGRILLTYASRNQGSRAIWVRFGSPDAKAWSGPMLLVDLEGSAESQYKGAPTDGGYPSSVVTADGTVVTVYYCRGVPAHQRYHMGVVRWRLAKAAP